MRNTFDAVKVKLIFNKKFNFKELTFKIEETATELSKKNINDTTLLLVLPENKDDYTVSVFSNEIVYKNQSHEKTLTGFTNKNQSHGKN